MALIRLPPRFRRARFTAIGDRHSTPPQRRLGHRATGSPMGGIINSPGPPFGDDTPPADWVKPWTTPRANASPP